jgi:hypothetical protein
VQIIKSIKKPFFEYHLSHPMYNPVPCYVSDFLFLATLQTKLLSLPSASFQSHSNLKIEISLLELYGYYNWLMLASVSGS